MKSPNLFSSPLIVGTMRLGKWGANFSTQEYEMFIHECLDLGLHEFDFADIYGDYTSEREFGEVLKKNPGLRNKITVTTKCGIRMVTENRPEHYIKSYDLSGQHIIDSAEQSLKNLGVHHIDLLLLHRPDFLMNPFEVVEAFTQLQQCGKVKYFGVSNYSPHQFKFLLSLYPIVTNQLEVSLLQLKAFTDDTLSICLKNKILPTAWSPFGGGALFKKPNTPRLAAIQKASKDLCEKYSCSLDQLLLAWLLKHPSGILPVLGSTKANNIKSALRAYEVNLSRQDWYVLWQASTMEEVA